MKLISKNNINKNKKLRIMCFIIDEKRPYKLTAKRDITCYKVLNEDYTSIVRKFQYELGKVYKGYIDEPEKSFKVSDFIKITNIFIWINHNQGFWIRILYQYITK